MKRPLLIYVVPNLKNLECCIQSAFYLFVFLHLFTILGGRKNQILTLDGH